MLVFNLLLAKDDLELFHLPATIAKENCLLNIWNWNPMGNLVSCLWPPHSPYMCDKEEETLLVN